MKAAQHEIVLLEGRQAKDTNLKQQQETTVNTRLLSPTSCKWCKEDCIHTRLADVKNNKEKGENDGFLTLWNRGDSLENIL